MELDFDNEIDALLRKESGERTITIGEFAGSHLDADEIVAFVENAVPERVRTSFVQHFAGCDPCRKALSHAILLHSDEGLDSNEGVTALPAAAPLSWYRRLFLFPKLTYVIGCLVVLFAGFIGLSILRSMYMLNSSEVSQMSANRPAAAVTETDGQAFSTNANNLPSATPSANTMANAANTKFPAVQSDEKSVSSSNTISNSMGTARAQEARTADGETRPAQPFAAPPKPPEKDQPAQNADDRLAQDSLAARPARENERKAEALKASPSVTRAPAAPLKEQPAAVNVDRDERTRRADMAKAKSDASPAAGSAADKKQVKGKTFEFRQGAWYDTTYRGQETVNVRRNTENFRKLDGGLRSIAESFIGTVVTVWNGKAYRID